MDKRKKPANRIKSVNQELSHVGGVNDELGGVDPQVDENLMRLSGGN